MRCARSLPSAEGIEPCLALWACLGSNLFLSIAKSALADQLRALVLPDRNVVFVVDDDPGMLMSLKRLLRTNGYDSVLFSSAKAFEEQVDFEDALCVVLNINLDPGSRY